MPRLFLALVLLVCTACGGSSPTAPAAPAPIPDANLVDGGGAQVTNCLPAPFSTCNFTASVKNNGPGCAANIRGVVKFFDGGSAQVGAPLNWSLPGTVPMLRAQETVAYTVFQAPASTLNAGRTYRVEVNWDNVRC